MSRINSVEMADEAFTTNVKLPSKFHFFKDEVYNLDNFSFSNAFAEIPDCSSFITEEFKGPILRVGLFGSPNENKSLLDGYWFELLRYVSKGMRIPLKIAEISSTDNLYGALRNDEIDIFPIRNGMLLSHSTWSDCYSPILYSGHELVMAGREWPALSGIFDLFQSFKSSVSICTGSFRTKT